MKSAWESLGIDVPSKRGNVPGKEHEREHEK